MKNIENEFYKIISSWYDYNLFSIEIEIKKECEFIVFYVLKEDIKKGTRMLRMSHEQNKFSPGSTHVYTLWVYDPEDYNNNIFSSEEDHKHCDIISVISEDEYNEYNLLTDSKEKGASA